MGNSLQSPVTEMVTSTGTLNATATNNNNNSSSSSSSNSNTKSGKGTTNENKSNDFPCSCTWGVSSMQGWRPTMEDAHIVMPIDIHHLDAGNDNNDNGMSNTTTDHYLFCVLDGHGGTLAAEYASQHLCSILKRQDAFAEYQRLLLLRNNTSSNNSTTTTTKGNSKKNKGGGRKKKHYNNGMNKTTSKYQYDKGQDKELLQRALEDAFVELDLQLLRHMVIDKGVFTIPTTTTTITEKLKEEEEQCGDESDDWDTALTDLEDYNAPTTTTSNNTEAESASGTTATVVLVTPDFFVCANIGDSRAVLLRQSEEQDQQPQIVELSHDHKPTLPNEASRIKQAGGYVNLGRVDGELAMSRAFGDFEFKLQPQSQQQGGGGEKDDLLLAMISTVINETSETQKLQQQQQKRHDMAQRLKVSPFPEVITAHRDPERDRILVIACDGIWDVMSNQECLDLIDTLLVQEGETNMGLVCEEVMETCLKQKGSRDNMTILVLKLEAQSMPGIGGGVKKRRKRRQK